MQVESFILDLLKKEVTEHLQPEADLSYGEETCWEQGVRNLGSISWPRKVTVHLWLRTDLWIREVNSVSQGCEREAWFYLPCCLFPVMAVVVVFLLDSSDEKH